MRKSLEVFWIVVDIIMIVLVLANLLWMAMDWFFTSPLVKTYLESYVPGFFKYYSVQIHPNFLLFDAVFVGIYLVEFISRWMYSASFKVYHKWFFYPFIHWYDLLGLMPAAPFRVLRLFRLVFTVLRLNKMGVIDVTKLPVYSVIKRYYNILMEEMTDRIVVNVIEGVQEEIKEGSPVTDRMILEIIGPHKEELVEWISQRIKISTAHNYQLYKDDVRLYLNDVVQKAVQKNKEMKDIEAIPVVGVSVKNAIQHAIGDITFNVINGMVEDLANNPHNVVMEETVNIVLETIMLHGDDQQLNDIVTGLANQSLELIKEQVKIQQWKLKT